MNDQKSNIEIIQKGWKMIIRNSIDCQVDTFATKQTLVTAG